jgi:hypothetical protein
LYDSAIHIDPTIYRIVLPEPSDYQASRQQAMDADLLNNFSAADGVPYFSKRFIMERYGGLSKDEIRRNEDMLRAEKALDTATGDDRDLPLLYQPEDAEAGGFDGGMGGGSMGGAPPEGGDEFDDLDGEEGGEGGEEAGGPPGDEETLDTGTETAAPGKL